MADPDGGAPGPGAGDLPAYDEAVLDVVDEVPAGRATTYGDVAAVLREAGWGGGPRTVGAVMARHGAAVAWWRVVRADGGFPACDEREALARLLAEGTPLRGWPDAPRVDLARARVDLARARVDLARARADLPAAPPPVVPGAARAAGAAVRR
ncbi:MAG: MGMT family protein [Kineosporiaceae bacterium]